MRPPASQPAAGLETAVGDLLTVASDPVSKGIGSLIKNLLIAIRPDIGHSVECTLYKYGKAGSNPASDEFHATMTIKSAKSARPMPPGQ